MKAKLFFLLKYYLFWVVISIVAKIMFLFYQWSDTTHLSAADFGHILVGGIRLDLSLSGYILMLSSVILVCSAFVGEKMIRAVFAGLTLLLLLFFWGVIVVDLELFKNWGFHIDSTPLMYLKTPKEALASTPLWLNLCLTLLMLTCVMSSFWVFRRYILKGLRYNRGNYWGIPVFLLIGGAMILPVRGGVNLAPLNSSAVFYHAENMYANQAAVNAVWNFIYELMHMKNLDTKYNYFPKREVAQVVDSLMHTGADYPRLLKTERPNIVLLLLESFTANAVEVLGGIPGVTPNLNQLAKEGVLFTNIYATGSRSDRGMVAAISAIPSHPAVAMIKYPNKIMERPRFPKDLEAAGYSTRYYYAGDIDFGCFRSLVTMSFQGMVTEDDFSGEAMANRFKWGVHDQYMFGRLYEDITQAQQPFMYMAFNLSSHEPFNVPGEVAISGNDTEHKFLNAIHYSDACIGEFIRKCKASDLWDNTLFILMADHGTRHIRHVDPSTPAAYHIPLILLGGALNVQDTVVTTIGSQTDMVATVLAQLGMDHSGYKFSRNLLADQVIPFAFFSYPNGVGVVTEKGSTYFSLQSQTFVAKDSVKEDGRLLKAYLQSINEDFNRQ